MTLSDVVLLRAAAERLAGLALRAEAVMAPSQLPGGDRARVRHLIAGLKRIADEAEKEAPC